MVTDEQDGCSRRECGPQRWGWPECGRWRPNGKTRCSATRWHRPSPPPAACGPLPPPLPDRGRTPPPAGRGVLIVSGRSSSTPVAAGLRVRTPAGRAARSRHGQPGLPDQLARRHPAVRSRHRRTTGLQGHGAAPGTGPATLQRITVAVDLREDWPAALAAAGHDPATPPVWIAEGLLIYLPKDAVELLLARISAQSATGSRMGLTLGTRGVIERFAAPTPHRDRPHPCGSRKCPTTRSAGSPDTAGKPTPTPLRERAAAYAAHQHPTATRGTARPTDHSHPPFRACFEL